MMISEVQSSIYNDLGSLSAEMTEDIVLLSNENPKAVFTELKLLREKAGQERSPDVAYLTFLHRKYVDVAASQKDSAGMRTHEVTPNLCAWEIEPYRQSEGQKTGWAATRSKLFRFRTILAILSLIIFAVMSSAPYILHRDFNPNHHFHRGCAFEGRFVGSFNFRGYQTVIAVGVLSFLHNVAHMVFTTLPVDANGQKYIPGATQLLARVLKSAHRAMSIATACAEFSTAHATFIEVLMDGLLLIMAVVTFAVSQYLFELAVPVVVSLSQENSYQSIYVDEYYTLSTCYLTYSNKTPACLDAGLNPTSKIRASLTFLFFAIVFQALCFLGSVRKFRSTDYYARLDDGTHQHQHQQQPDSPTFEHFPHTSTGNSAKSEDVGKFIDVRPNVSDSFYSNSAHMSARSESAVGGLSLSSSGGGGGGGGSGGIRAEEKTSLYSMVEGGEENLSLEEHSV